MRKLRIEDMQRLSVETFRSAPKRPLVAVLDNVRSMHNVGSVLRTADAFRLERVYLCGFTPAPPHRDIRKTALGAEDSVDWVVHADTAVLLDTLRAAGYQILVAEQTESSIPLPDFCPDPAGAYAVVFGHEVDGVDDEALARAQVALEIPQAGTKHSLNVAVAAGIVLYALAMALPLRDGA
ncbi:MAG: RNA methyltransferase [Bacteroidia bacterium]